ncbi:hypothetical protein D9M70_586020 [compost metagenome]
MARSVSQTMAASHSGFGRRAAQQGRPQSQRMSRGAQRAVSTAWCSSGSMLSSLRIMPACAAPSTPISPLPEPMAGVMALFMAEAWYC